MENRVRNTPHEPTIRPPLDVGVEWLSPVALSDLPGPAQTRITATLACRDCDLIPKVPDAGRIFRRGSETIQIMHNGIFVVAGGYYGDWMSRIIAGLHGHHEPQEELIMHAVVAHARPATLFVELGAYWAYYTNWYLAAVPNARAVCVEPEGSHLEMGRRNLALNSRQAIWIQAFIGGEFHPTGPNHEVACLDMAALMAKIDHAAIEVLHMDIQGAELGFLQSIRHTDAIQRIRFIVISTHHAAISGTTTTHQDCVAELLAQGAVILVEHSVEESFSCDGLIVASFDSRDRWLRLPPISRAPEELSSLSWEAAALAQPVSTAPPVMRRTG